jgi:hypothetical protein
MGHFGRDKTYEMLDNHFYWPKMRRDVARLVQRYVTCHKAKSKLNPRGLYIHCPFLVFHGRTLAWILSSVYLGQRGGGILFFVVVDRL